MSDKKSCFEPVLKLLYFCLPLFCLVFGLYFAYFHIFLNNNILKTKNDIVQIVSNMSETFKGSYPSLDANILVMQNILPYDFPIRKTVNSYDVSNRFGGKIFFYNAYNTLAERIDNPDNLSAYIILFTRLTKKECKKLAQTDWRRNFPNFLGLEASYLSAQKTFNGVYNLRNYLLFDNLNEQYNSRDEGFITRRHLSRQETKVACGCLLNTCTVALKFK